MKATCIIGSGRDGGSTAYLVDTMIRGMNGAEISRYCLGTEPVHFCLGCKKCYVDGKCVQEDAVETMVGEILKSDVVVIAAPSYWGDVPGQLKTFFDRNTPYGDTNPQRRLKAEKRIKGVAIAVRAGRTERENSMILDSIEHYFGHLGIEPVKRISVCETDSLEDLLQKHQPDIAALYQLGQQIGIL